MNKFNADLILVHPQWEPIKIDIDEKFYHELDPAIGKMLKGRKIVHGILYQAGWLAQNPSGIWLGLPMDVEYQFEDLGPLG